MKIFYGYNGHEYDLEEILQGSIGPGWIPLVMRLAESLVEAGWNRRLLQVKEKWGGLRFYIDYGNSEVFRLIEEAEKESYFICEDCGNNETAAARNDGWIRTLCNDCESRACKARREMV